MINMPIMPDGIFWKWALKSLCKGAYFSAVVGLIWIGFTQVSSDRDTLSGQIMFVASSAVDSTFVFVIVATAFLIGLMHNSWDNIFTIARQGRKRYVDRLLWGIILSMSFTVLTNVMMFQSGLRDNHAAYLAVTYTISAGFALLASYSVYMIEAVFTKEEAREYEEQRRSSAMKRIFTAFPIFNRTKMSFSIIIGCLIPALCLTGAIKLADRIGANWSLPLVFSIMLSLSVVLLGILLRLWDMIKVFGQQEKLVPHYELHLAKGRRSTS